MHIGESHIRAPRTNVSSLGTGSSLCYIVQSCLTLCDPWAVAHQVLLSMGFSLQEYWNGVPFPPPGDLPDPGIKPTSLSSPALAGGFFTTSASTG